MVNIVDLCVHIVVHTRWRWRACKWSRGLHGHLSGLVTWHFLIWGNESRSQTFRKNPSYSVHQVFPISDSKSLWGGWGDGCPNVDPETRKTCWKWSETCTILKIRKYFILLKLNPCLSLNFIEFHWTENSSSKNKLQSFVFSSVFYQINLVVCLLALFARVHCGNWYHLLQFIANKQTKKWRARICCPNWYHSLQFIRHKQRWSLPPLIICAVCVWNYS